jgi:acetyl-CoA synthetase
VPIEHRIGAYARRTSDRPLRALEEVVGSEIGKFARPDDVRFADALPKTRSGKIMRRLLQDLASGRPPGDMTALEDMSVLQKLNTNEE